MEHHEFLEEKYSGLAGSKHVEKAVKKARESGKSLPDKKDARIDAYLKHLEEVTGDEQKFRRLKETVINEYTLNFQDEETLSQVAKGLYESEKRIAIEQGRATDIEKFESTHDVIRHYKPLIQEKGEIQRKTLTEWLDYLQKNDGKLPMWFRYFVVRSLEKMGTLDKEKGDYTKRTSTTIATFPELNSEALGWVYNRLNEGLEAKYYVPQTAEVQQNKDKLVAALRAKDFAKLYAFAQIDTAGKLNRESIEGEWKKYDQGSDHTVLEQDLRGKGTGWCTAESSAKEHLEGGDFYVYYTKTDSGYTQPRVAIRMEGENVAEVRGVNPKQELEPELVDIAQAQYHNLPGGEKYDKKAKDMKKVTELVKKQEQNKAFTTEEIIFLYERDSQIEGFGYERDPRIEALRKKRNPREDAPIVFECEPNQIAWKEQDINENTKAYIGPLFNGIFALKNLEYTYTSFPEGKIIQQTIEVGGKTKGQLEEEITAEGMQIYDIAKKMMQNSKFVVSNEMEKRDLVRLKVGDFGFTDCPTMTELYQRAQEFGLELCSDEVGPQLILQFKDQPLYEYLYVGMNLIPTAVGGGRIFKIDRGDRGICLSGAWTLPWCPWDHDDQFVFSRRK